MLFNSLISLLFSNSVTLRRDLSIFFNRIAILALTYSILHHILSLVIFTSKGISLHGGLLHITNITQIFHVFLFVLCILILLLTSFYPRKVWILECSSLKHLLFNSFIYYRTKIINKMGEQFRILEYPLIILFIINGAVFLMSTNDLVSIFLSIELQSYGLYLLSTIYRNSELSTTSGLIYFLLGGLSSCFILLGSSLLYANSGTTNLDGLYVITNINDLNSWYKPYYINFSLLIFSIGFLFKISAAPFHFWSPDVYDGVPTVVTAVLTTVAKLSIFIFLVDLVYYTSSNFVATSGGELVSFGAGNHHEEVGNLLLLYHPQPPVFSWIFGLLLSSLFSLLIGTVVGLTQFRIKRLLAYSTISHVGFILLALSVNTIESIQAFIFYLMQYSISNLNIFIILLAIGFSLYCFVTSENQEHKELLDKNNSPIQLISQLKGYFYINPLLSLSLAITIFSFVGIPPLIGFFAKQMVLSAALDSGYIFISLIGILTSVIGAVYYLNIIKEVFFYLPDYKLNPLLNNFNINGSIFDHNNVLVKSLTFNYKNIVLSSSITVIISIITLIILLFIFINREWLNMGAILVQILFNGH